MKRIYLLKSRILFFLKKIEIDPIVRRPVITFGRFCGKCQGVTCVEIFMLTDVELLEDSLDKYPVSGSL